MTNTNSADGFATISVAAVLAESAKRTPDSIALVVGEEQVSYGDLWRQTRAYAGALRARGVGPGDAVAVLIPNVPDFARVYYAILSLGAIVVPVHALLKAREIEYVLQDSGAKLLICAAPLLGEGAAGATASGIDVLTVMAPDDGGFPRLEAEAADAEPIRTYEPCRPSDTATILYTSGTTGKPKGALGTHFALVEQTSTLLTSVMDFQPGDVLFGGLPLFHTFGQTVVLNTGLRAGVTIVLMPRFTGEDALKLLAKHNVNIFIGVPTMYVALLEAAKTVPDRPAALRYGISGGASLPLAVMDRFRDVYGVEIHEGYGLTETSPVAAFNHVGTAPRPGTIGIPIWGVDIEIARPEVVDSIELLPNGELGELVIRGHLLMKGYLNRPEATAEAVVDGWFRSGDLGTKDDDGYLTIVDRKKDMIIRNGYNVYPREVEEILLTHPAVVSAAVYGIPDEVHGQEIAAAIVLDAGASVTEAELIDFASAQLAAYKYPRVVRILSELPLGPSGKILKRKLAEDPA
ncbi:long-chain fatty acid--CoA ligase [Arthrobacter sp. FW306-05-C]|uniref:long-chain-fatty-acid--CoA ligase n=1 Tax=unclassified Arthrobacter TaxID=235627 RepID=UPI001EF155BF|nr:MULTISPECIES: long-chain fatty acid--CoA ligase [unclassified Arthrobacter]UKA67178.1 long-chain fatty acid--CoA ligase [Arthrobacter sp. FW306-05-C]UKA71644.1 long-chain fatty acid--CoA ligase [Arthrobacter sp. FW306-06-A]